MCLALFGIAALSVDLGNAFARRTDTQTQADYGALAAARMQTETAKAGMTFRRGWRRRPRRDEQQPATGRRSGCWPTKTCVTRHSSPTTT